MATVLVADDLAMHRALATGLLARDRSWQVIQAVDGKQALDLITAQRVDVVLTDLLMPEMNGLELLRAARRLQPDLPVVLMTASGSEELAMAALKEGAASYVPKRALARQLMKTLERVLAACTEQRLPVDMSRHLTLQQFDFVLDNDLALLMAVPVYLRPFMLACGKIDKLARMRVHLALEEALVNALVHGNLEIGAHQRDMNAGEFARLAQAAPYLQRRIYMRARMTAGEVQFTIRDEGPGFGAALLHQTDAARLDGTHGRGILLMRAFMDEVRFNDAGNEVTIIKR